MSNLFFRARVKLTIYYIIILAIILTVFSAVLYYSLSSEIKDSFEGNLLEGEAQSLLIVKTTDQLQTSIIVIDVVSLVVFGSLSYLLAGRTFKPINNAMEAQKRFTSDASHELRTPLSIIEAELEMGLRDKSTTIEEFRRIAKSVLDETKNLTKLTSDLLTIARFSEQTKNRKIETVDIYDLVLRTAKKMRTLADKKNIKLSFESRINLYVRGDKDALERLFTNILSNAINYTPDGGAIDIFVEQYKGIVLTAIKDNGVGISEDDLPHIFDRLYRADKSRNSFVPGTGLGLSIAYEIVKQHHGRITAESKAGEGTTVRIELPAIK